MILISKTFSISKVVEAEIFIARLVLYEVMIKALGNLNRGRMIVYENLSCIPSVLDCRFDCLKYSLCANCARYGI